VKQKRAVLYELMRDHRGVGGNGISSGRLGDLAPSPIAADDLEPSGELLPQPGVIRLPVGYIFLGLAAILIIALGAYLIGHSRGSGDEDSALAGTSGEAESLTPPQSQMPPRQAGSAPTQGVSSPPRTAGPIESNPRKPGENYFVLVQTSRTNAIRVAEFCRKNGLEAYVDRVNNADFRVFVLPGYTAEEMASPAVAELERRIEAVKKAWNESVGRNDLGQHIAVKYRGT
jgi:hypothetical protein